MKKLVMIIGAALLMGACCGNKCEKEGACCKDGDKKECHKDAEKKAEDKNEVLENETTETEVLETEVEAPVE